MTKLVKGGASPASSDAASDHYRHAAPVCRAAVLYRRICVYLHGTAITFMWRATIRASHDNSGHGWCFTCFHKMLRQTHGNVSHACASKSSSRHFDASRSLPPCCPSLRATVCGGHDDIGGGWCFTCLLWMLRPTNSVMEHLRASQPCHSSVFRF